jgi:hypothetical protein
MSGSSPPKTDPRGMKVGEIFGQEQTLTTSQKFLRVVIQLLLDFNFHHHEDGLSTLQSASVNLTLIVAWSQLIACIEKKAHET